MNTMKIHQFSPSANHGDGITNGMLYFQKILTQLKFVSYIYAQKIEDDLEGVKSYKEFDKTDKNQIIFIHYSIYYDFSAWIDTLTINKHIIYHNITPPEFFKNDKFLYEMCKKGLEMLPSLPSKFDGAIGDSELNSNHLKNLDFKNVHTIPLLVDTNKIINASWNKDLFDSTVDDFNIIFVGRLARNKAQHDIIEIARIYRYINENFKFYIIGGTTDKSYEYELKQKIISNNLQDKVILTGKVTNQDLYAYYKSANVFLCMSEHEGFGIPLIESMLFSVPIVAYDSSNIKDTLNQGGILFHEKSHQHIAATIQVIRENPKFRYEVLKTQKDALDIYQHDNIIKKLIAYLNIFDIPIDYTFKKQNKTILYQFEGPFDSSYSLAILNRHAALSFDKLYPKQVSLYSLEGDGDFEPSKTFLLNNQHIDDMYKLSKKAIQCEVTLRNLYPPKVTGMKSQINILNSYGWEESSFPKEYVKNFNENLDGIIAVSHYVKKTLVNNGVKVPICVINNSIDHILENKPEKIQIKSRKSFRFLHISSCFPRKGIDVLLEAYGKAFSIGDDVVLIIKTFPNVHNNIEKDIFAIQSKYKNYPSIELINKDLDEVYITWLYQNSHCLVAPSRGEGFGLPMAEAMLFELPVIVTGYGGQVDFCNHQTAWLIDYSFQASKTHMDLFDSYWVQPCVQSLKTLMKQQFNMPIEDKIKKTSLAKELVVKNFTWDNYTQKTLKFIQNIKDKEIFNNKEKNLAWISSYNTQCGIATYSDFLLTHFSKYNINIYANHSADLVSQDKEDKTIRCWNNRFDLDNEDLIEHILSNNTTDVVINFNFSFFSMINLEQMLKTFYKHNINTTIIFHSVQDVTIKGLEASLSWISKTLKYTNNLIVHNINDLNILKAFDLVDNAILLPHGVQKRKFFKEPKLKKSKFNIASFGFMLPHKGIKELIEAFALVYKKNKRTHLFLINALYPDDIAKEYLKTCQETIQKYNLHEHITMKNEFISDKEVFYYLDKADLLVMPYKQTQESVSGAVRYSLSTLKPVLVTPIDIFKDISSIVHFTKDETPKEVSRAIINLMQDNDLLHCKEKLQKKWLEEHSWDKISNILQNIINNS